MDRRQELLTVLGGGIPATNPDYLAKALSYSPVAFWPLTGDALDVSGNGYHGTPSAQMTYTGGGRDNRRCAYFNDAAWLDVYSAGLAAAFSGDEFVIGGWAKQTDAALTDGDTHDFPVFYSDTAGNFLFMRSTNGSLAWARDASSVHQGVTAIAAGNFGSAWRHLLFRCSLVNNRIGIINNGAVLGNFAVSAAWQGPNTVLGSLWGASSGASKIHHWLGWMQYVGIWPYLSDAQCLDLATMV